MGSKPHYRSGTQLGRRGESTGPGGLGLCQHSSSSPTAASHCTSSSDTPSFRYWSITQSYFHNAYGVLLLYNISSPSSFISVCQWIKDIMVGRVQDTAPRRGAGALRLQGGGMCCAPTCPGEQE